MSNTKETQSTELQKTIWRIREVVNLTKLNAEIAAIVTQQAKLRTSILVIVTEQEGKA